MFEYELSLPIVLGTGFSGSYWLLDVLHGVVPRVDDGAILVIAPVLGLVAAVAAAVAATRTLSDGENLAGRTARHVASWIILFPGTAILVTYAGRPWHGCCGPGAWKRRCGSGWSS